MILPMTRKVDSRSVIHHRSILKSSISSSNPNVGTFVSHEKKHVCKSLNALSALNGSFDNLCAGRWLISYLFVTTNS